MLRNIPATLAPELLKVMMEMGHNDYLVLADANFPAAGVAKRLIRQDGVDILELLDAVVQFFPLDNFIAHPVVLMQPRDTEPTPEIWTDYERILRERDQDSAFREFHLIERMSFYEYAKDAYAVVQTGTTARYANIGLHKGVV